MIENALLFFAERVRDLYGLDGRWIDPYPTKGPNVSSEMNNYRTVGKIERKRIDVHGPAGALTREARTIQNTSR